MEITTEHLEAIRRVLTRKVTRKQVATDYSPMLKTMVGVTILQGAGVKDDELIKPRGMYGDLLYELTVVPGIPADRWQDRYDALPDWFMATSKSRLVERARNYGFHKTKHRQGHDLTFVGHPKFEALLCENPSFVGACHVMHDEARRAVIQRSIDGLRQRRIEQRQRAKELRQRPELRAEFAKILGWFPDIIGQPDKVTFGDIDVLTGRLNDLVMRYDPKS